MSAVVDDVATVRRALANAPDEAIGAFANLLAHLDEAGKLLRATQPGLMNFREWSDAIDAWLEKDKERSNQ